MKHPPFDRNTTRSKLGIALLFVALAAVLGGCNLISGAPTPTPFVPVRVVVTPQPTATPVPTETPPPEDLTPTPTPLPTSKLTSGTVRQLVFTALSQCANQISANQTSQDAEGSVELEITATFRAVEGVWQSQVTSSDQLLYFGTWHTSDETGGITPVDVVATDISAPDTVCSEPTARLSQGPIPVLALPPAPTPIISAREIAQLRVWVHIYNCYKTFPALDSFTAYEKEPGAGVWIVEGVAEDARYGLWEVDSRIQGSSEQITPVDQLAKQVEAPCNLPPGASFSPVITNEQAALRVWAAVYDCFTPRPENTNFKVLVDNPQRWLVEGRGEETIEVQVEKTEGGVTEVFTEERTTTVFYGLYIVDATTGLIIPWDTLAIGTGVQPCYRPP